MDFMKANLINTTTQIAVNSNTLTAQNLINPDIYYQYYSDGFADDSLTSTITITFDATTNVSRLILADTNFKEFSIFYNGVTANTFAMTTTGSTVASSFTGNTETHLYLRCNTVACTSVTINAKKTQTAAQEKLLGQFVISDNYFTLSRIPDSSGYKPVIRAKQIVHKLSDGGTRIHNIRKKYEATLSFDYLSTTLRDSLEDIYNLNSSFTFAPFGTTTAWDKIFFDSVWEGDFNFYEYSDNALASGFSGSVKLKETSA
jgi:hypothetical protein